MKKHSFFNTLAVTSLGLVILGATVATGVQQVESRQPSATPTAKALKKGNAADKKAKR